MAMTTLNCPHCSFFQEMNASMLPPPGTRATCPKCKGAFFLPDHSLPSEPERIDLNPPAESQPRPEVASAFDAGDEPSFSPPTPGTTAPELSAVSQPPRTRTFTFTGNAREYFGIWIVNTLLRIVTLGIYSPWAKVRKRRYFYGNTLLDDAPFDYLADPLAILKGWFIAGAFIGLYSVATRVNPLLALVLTLVFLGVLPWAVVRSRIFNAQNSSYRNIRFGFLPDYGKAYRVFLWWQLLVPFTLGILWPYVIYRQKRFLVENSSYGVTPFRFHARAGEYYRIFLPFLVLIPLTLGAFVGLAALAPKGGTAAPLLTAIPVLLSSAVYMFALVYVPTALSNLTLSSTSIDGHRFACTLRVRDLLWIYLSNAVCILFTLGMMAPWAAVRLARYRLRRLAVTGVGGFDLVSAAAGQEIGAAGEEIGEMLDFDLGL